MLGFACFFYVFMCWMSNWNLLWPFGDALQRWTSGLGRRDSLGRAAHRWIKLENGRQLKNHIAKCHPPI